MKIRFMIAVFAVLLSSCGASAPTGGETVNIDMVGTGDGFSPERVTVSKGTRVCWINKDSDGRWPASNIHPTHEIYSEFDPKQPVREGETWCFVFSKPGIWKYHDHLLPEFVGTVNVE